ncbi:Retrovirus-related Pol polyprotein from transposon RE1 [Vitis vinifera]|uniref:Retrovirus-related Pol polyprotein from transposon RE1 n=1 Tax=Vitis vinifera TaxID=29760 RepID=A0A438JML9_VITVI|nr:Retrovirus-related Pol polyprotein from transposon RE1 [Vitis vinifera]
MATKNPIFTSVISGSPTITLEKLIGSENYLSWPASVELWFMRQGYEDHLVTPKDVIPDVDKVQWKKIDAQLCSAKGLYTNDIQRFYKVVSDIVHVRQQDMDLSTYISWIASLKEAFLTLMPFTNGAEAQQIQTDKFFMVLTLIGLRPNLESVRDQIFATPSVPSLDDVFARLLRLCSTQTLSTDGPSDSSVLASQTNSRGGRSGNRGRGQRPRSTSQSITLTDSDYDAYLQYQAATSASVASVAQTGNVSVYFTQSPSLGPWILNSGTSDHISGQALRQGYEMHLIRILSTSEGLSLLFPDTHRYFLSADVAFFEDSPFFSSSESLPISEVPDDLPPVPPISPTPALSSTDHLPIVLRKGNRSTRNPHPIYNFLSYHRLSLSYSAFVSTLSSVSLPKSTNEALSHSGWRQAMVDEMAALHSNGTWDLVSLPLGKSTVGCRWVYTIKVGPDDQVDRLKVRLVAKAMCHWPLYQLDIKNAFLHGELLDEMYMEQPPGFVCSGGVWFSVQVTPLSIWLETVSSGMCIYLIVYVDGIVITSSDQEGIQRLKQHLFNHFQTKDLGKLKYFLGLEIAQSSSGVVMSQRKYALDILEEIGKLNYLTITRPDIFFPMSEEHQAKVCCMKTGVIPKLLVTQMQTGLVHPQIGVPPQVARSSAEAEYRAMALATCELIWLRQLLQELRFGKDEQIKLICDNQVALHIASNPVFHERTKHIKVDYHFIREKIASGCVATSFVNSNDQLADIFTKSLRGPKIKYICNKLSAYDIYAPA